MGQTNMHSLDKQRRNHSVCPFSAPRCEAHLIGPEIDHLVRVVISNLPTLSVLCTEEILLTPWCEVPLPKQLIWW